MESKGSIKDSRIKVTVSKELVNLLEQYKNHLIEIPENVIKVLQTQSIQFTSRVETINDNTPNNNQPINIELLRKVLKVEEKVQKNAEKIKKDQKCFPSSKDPTSSIDVKLYLSDLRWLSNFLAKLRKDEGLNVYLNDVLESCQVDLPQNEIIKRNPVLEARCQKLREEQQNLEYRKMTKNVDAVLKHYPEDTIAYQIKAINSQLIAVLQFIFSVAAGFAFGFLGVNLIFGNIEFGLRLLLGIMCALIIALAEIYFLAKKLNEYDNTVDTVNIALKKASPSTKKSHAD